MVKNEMLDTVDTTLFLGLTLSAKLQWNSHITRLAKRLSSAAYAMKRIRRLPNKSTTRLEYIYKYLVYVKRHIESFQKGATFITLTLGIRTILLLMKPA
ncbi:hypothetical protein EVAR_67609_1 [Eumeta japonica]|uniref:Uncharacterized protein n=1 Tax=Eumeta variegata TaxID=151549 RepID=A0A4C1ZT42_EUMVA|nr:hypothetical protein EVAR_67609_1 [Eumeta japonica]